VVIVPCPPTIRALTHALAPQGYCPAHRDPKFVREGVVTQGAAPVPGPLGGSWDHVGAGAGAGAHALLSHLHDVVAAKPEDRVRVGMGTSLTPKGSWGWGPCFKLLRVTHAGVGGPILTT
jgi:hypothetical protein